MNNTKKVSLYLRRVYDLEPVSFDDIREYGLLDEFNRLIGQEIDSLGDSVGEIVVFLRLCSGTEGRSLPNRLSDGTPTFLKIVKRREPLLRVLLEIREYIYFNPPSLVEQCLKVCPKDLNILKLPAELKERMVKYMTKEKQILIFSEYKCQYDNGHLKKHYYYSKNDNNKWRREGEGKSWYENGNLMKHRFYKNGKEEGEYTKWYEDGKLEERCY